MNALEPAPVEAPPPEPRSGWSAGWIAFACAAILLQVAGFWLVSPSPTVAVAPGVRPPARTVFLPLEDSGESASLADTWLSLWSPAVFLHPSERDFSGPAWLEGSLLRVEMESFTVPERPLPFEAAPPPGEAAPRSGPWTRLDPGPGSRWLLAPGMPPARVPGEVPLPVSGRLRLLGEFDGWRPDPVADWPAGSAAGVGRPALVRVTLGPDGEAATAPTLWESSGVEALDTQAVELAARLRWRHPARAPVHDPGQDPGAPWAWGLVEIDWARPPAGP